MHRSVAWVVAALVVCGLACKLVVFDPMEASRRSETAAGIAARSTHMTPYNGFYTPTQVSDVSSAIAAGKQPYAGAMALQLVLPGSAILTDGKGNPARYLAQSATPHAVKTLSIPSVYDTTGQETAQSEAASKNAIAGLTNDADAAHALALLFRLTGNPVYGAGASNIVTAWTNTNTAWMPHERVVGKIAVEDDAPLAMGEVATGFVLAADLLTNHYTGWGQNDANAVIARRWVRTVYLPAVESVAWPNMQNNWADWAAYGYVSGNAYLGQTSAISAYVPTLETMIGKQIASDGSLPAEVERGKGSGIWYSYFALAPLCATARIVRNSVGVDLFRWQAPSGGSIPKALTHLLNWVKAPDGYTGPRVQDPWPADLFLAMAAEYSVAPPAGVSAAAFSAYAATKANHPIVYTGQMEAWNFQSLMAIPGQ